MKGLPATALLSLMFALVGVACEAEKIGPTKQAHRKVYVETKTGLIYKPTWLSYSGGLQTIDRIHWVSYGGSIAIGRARFGDCSPDCTRGHYSYRRFTLKLMDVERCNGVLAYKKRALLGVAGVYEKPQPIVITRDSSAHICC
jgi:hypothetical protein